MGTKLEIERHSESVGSGPIQGILLITNGSHNSIRIPLHDCVFMICRMLKLKEEHMSLTVVRVKKTLHLQPHPCIYTPQVCQHLWLLLLNYVPVHVLACSILYCHHSSHLNAHNVRLCKRKLIYTQKLLFMS